jgi:hypothetical protein
MSSVLCPNRHKSSPTYVILLNCIQFLNLPQECLRFEKYLFMELYRILSKSGKFAHYTNLSNVKKTVLIKEILEIFKCFEIA